MRKTILAAPALLILSLLSCVLPVKPEPPTSTPRPTRTPTPTPDQPPIMADCFITFYLSAYVDADGDGARDEGEGDLPGVEFILHGNYAHSLAGGRAVTDEAGQASIDTWSPGGCGEFSASFSIDAVPPPGYQPSTPLPFEVQDDRAAPEYAFGFQPQ